MTTMTIAFAYQWDWELGQARNIRQCSAWTALMHTATWYDILHHLWYGYCGVE